MLHRQKPLDATMTNDSIRQHKVAQNRILMLAIESVSVLECLYNFFGGVGHVVAELAARAVFRVSTPT